MVGGWVACCLLLGVGISFLVSGAALSQGLHYRKDPKNSDTQKICCNHAKIWTRWFYRIVMHLKDADGIANSVDPDQTAPPGAVWFGSALFARTHLSENLGSLRLFRADDWNRMSITCQGLSIIYFFSNFAVSQHFGMYRKAFTSIANLVWLSLNFACSANLLTTM